MANDKEWGREQEKDQDQIGCLPILGSAGFIEAPQEAAVWKVAQDPKAIVEAWFAEQFQNNWVSQNTVFYNKLYEAKQDLLGRL